jgi:hypothetical protein
MLPSSVCLRRATQAFALLYLANCNGGLFQAVRQAAPAERGSIFAPELSDYKGVLFVHND